MDDKTPEFMSDCLKPVWKILLVTIAVHQGPWQFPLKKWKMN